MEQIKIATDRVSDRSLPVSARKRQTSRHQNFENGFEAMLESLTPAQIFQLGYQVLAHRPVTERHEFSREFVRALEAEGVNVFTFFVLLGIDATDVGELTPTDFAMLLRYFKLNNRPIFTLAVRVLMRHPEVVRSVIVQINKSGV